MDPAVVGDELNEISVLVNVAHRLLVAIRDDLDADPALQVIVDDLNAAHDQLDLALETLGRAIDAADRVSGTGPRDDRPAIH